jgi:hypothetical protein
MRKLSVILLSLICIDIAAQNVDASEIGGFQLLTDKFDAEPPVRDQEIHIVWEQLTLEWKLLFDATPVNEWEPSVADGTATSSTIERGFYFDPYSAYTTHNAQLAGEGPPGWTPRGLYMSARPATLCLRHFCVPIGSTR